MNRAVQQPSKVEYKGTVCVCVFLSVCVCMMGRQSGMLCPPGPPATAAPAPSLSPRGSAVTFALVALAGVCTYINVICINVIRALFPLQGLQPDTGVIIWKRGGEEETSVELIILTRASRRRKAGEGQGDKTVKTEEEREVVMERWPDKLWHKLKHSCGNATWLMNGRCHVTENTKMLFKTFMMWN